MQYDSKTTKLTIKADRSTGISSLLHGSNIDAMGFNIGFIMLRKPSLAIEIIKTYKEARRIDENDPKASSKDLTLANEELLKVVGSAFNKDH